MPELRSHKRGRSLDQRLFCNSEQRFITTSGEVDAEETRSESDYDSDVMVVGKGRKCPRVSRTPPNHVPSSKRTVPLQPTSPILPRIIANPALLEWYSESPRYTSPCLHELEITELKARVGYLEIEAQQNIELQSEIQQNYCQISAECRKLRQDFCRVSAECTELQKTMSDLVQSRRWEELRRQGEEEDRTELEKWVNDRIVAAEKLAREQVTQLKVELFNELESAWARKSRDTEQKRTSSTIPMDIEKPTIEELFDTLNSNGGLNESCHAPENPTDQQPKQPMDNLKLPPIGPKVWREKRAKRQQSTKPNASS
jgi:hypothetical protein